MSKKKDIYSKPTLDTRVKTAKGILKDLGIKRAKIKFFDAYYGTIDKSLSMKIDNLWAGYTTQLDFTEKLESYAKQCKIKSV